MKPSKHLLEEPLVLQSSFSVTRCFGLLDTFVDVGVDFGFLLIFCFDKELHSSLLSPNDRSGSCRFYKLVLELAFARGMFAFC